MFANAAAPRLGPQLWRSDRQDLLEIGYPSGRRHARLRDRSSCREQQAVALKCHSRRHKVSASTTTSRTGIGADGEVEAIAAPRVTSRCSSKPSPHGRPAQALELMVKAHRCRRCRSVVRRGDRQATSRLRTSILRCGRRRHLRPRRASHARGVSRATDPGGGAESAGCGAAAHRRSGHL